VSVERGSWEGAEIRARVVRPVPPYSSWVALSHEALPDEARGDESQFRTREQWVLRTPLSTKRSKLGPCPRIDAISCASLFMAPGRIAPHVLIASGSVEDLGKRINRVFQHLF
jgi:hypothetical protein